MRRNPICGLAAVALLFTAGCASFERPIERITCHVRLTDVKRKVDQQRVGLAIRSVAVEPVRKTGSAANTEYHFAVRRLEDLDKIHPQILYKNPTAWRASRRRQTLNVRTPTFSVTYDSTDIEATIQVSVTFRVKPGSRLFYRPQGGDEMDITSQVDSSGQVVLRTKITRGQKYILARTVQDEVSRYIKINVHTQQVTDIEQEDY